ncbi:MAG: DUF1566 domain-containing protein, partial [Hydrogenophaga sp.]|nr:DUF1566 domain-containing protein [Hydrogenophaga sp.]
PSAVETDALMQEGAQLNAEELQAAATQRVASNMRTKALTGVPVYRFYNTQTAAHFYTISEEERATVQNTLPQFQYDGPAFTVSPVTQSGLSPVYRFFNTQTGVHFYTISSEEKAHIELHLPQFKLEGVAYYASRVSGSGLAPLYRFYQTQRGFHFYSANYTERDSVVESLPVYHFEGVGYYVLAGATTPIEPPGPLNDTGVVGNQCYQAGSSALVSCDSAGARALNYQQDGMIGRDRNAPEDVDGAKGFSFTKISNGGTELPASAALGSGPGDWACTRDNVTGLVWEVGNWNGANRLPGGPLTYHVDNLNAPQYLGRQPTLAELDSHSNSLGYRNWMNSLGLCGFSDWRLPTVTEAQGLVDFSKPDGVGAIDSAWLSPGPGNYQSIWTAEPLVYLHPDLSSVYSDGVDAYAWGLTNNGSVWPANRSNWSGQLRLVRGSTPGASTRFVFAGNGAEVVDQHTGLTWRRCLEGMSWNGSACVGTSQVFRHEAALAHANTQGGGWRVPNVKELATIMDRRYVRGYDPVVFPNTPDYGKSWTSTPVITGADSGFAVWIAKFKWGVVDHDSDGRTSSMLRLVKKTK